MFCEFSTFEHLCLCSLFRERRLQKTDPPREPRIKPPPSHLLPNPRRHCDVGRSRAPPLHTPTSQSLFHRPVHHLHLIPRFLVTCWPPRIRSVRWFPVHFLAENWESKTCFSFEPVDGTWGLSTVPARDFDEFLSLWFVAFTFLKLWTRHYNYFFVLFTVFLSPSRVQSCTVVDRLAFFFALYIQGNKKCGTTRKDEV